ncbi:23S rRNA (pseudouridine1915-N3)-methyltransferase [Desulfacinum hydrothermale DSM 13146]|uniref:Ribosomal RNA large subunit methyltransferase H n=1 Tax=Desulfacinum hydrothermale DSM 13146 TaxID=1121390 RepID=A0A1W1XF33_9BACT|nr:23S rRNA (pseudouridine(1915)-N(3))-methyltransferase RlmH [Desulfacinum hydrothermale]SMC22467.1 23S rRNA (pseudouridine1915-N3)-methyltransferase [Desulfacinum hydrothermale DSM 13146]
MKIHLIFVGKTVFPEMEDGIQRYLDRLQHYAPVQVHVVKPEKMGKKMDADRVKEKEGQKILHLPRPQDTLIAWDERGRQMTSGEFADLLSRMQLSSWDLWMAVGGPLGLSDEVRRKANHILSLSKMTLPHDLARLVIVEQLYRAFTILRGEPYHK